MSLLALGAAAIALGGVHVSASEPVTVEFHIQQDMDLILFSDFGEPPQFAIWLEDPGTHALKTVFVTHRSATGEWEGKLECPAALPRWFEVYRKEFGHKGLPRPHQAAPDGVSGATPQVEDFAWRVPLAEKSRWICWIEVNISADYNAHFQPNDEASGQIDTDCSGQPSVLYRAELEVSPGAEVKPELWAYTVPGTMKGEIVRDLEPITTARDIFTSIAIRVVDPDDADAGAVTKPAN